MVYCALSSRYVIVLVCAFLCPRVWADYQAQYATEVPIIDGYASDSIWHDLPWYNLDQLHAGSQPSPEDFSGRFKIAWRESHVYIMAEIIDDVLVDSHANPLENYWQDDCLEVFIDEDASGGNHQQSHQAFAYHIALDNQVVDMGPSLSSSPIESSGLQQPIVSVNLYNSHIQSRWRRQEKAPYPIIWEVALQVYGAGYVHGVTDAVAGAKEPQRPVVLTPGKVMGFMLSYCDADGTNGREHFMGSEKIAPVNGDRNRGYIDASVFGRLMLKKH